MGRINFSDLVTSDFEFSMGSPSPLGASLQHGGVNFAIFSKHATSVSLVLFGPDSDDSLAEFPFDSRYNRTGQIWHALLRGIGPGIHYGYRIAGEAGPLHHFNSGVVLLDPSAKCVAGRPVWGYPPEASHSAWTPRYLRRAVVIDDAFDWQLDKPLNIPLSDSILYELHVRGLTKHHSSGVSSRGTFAGVVEKIPYLKHLGVTAVELLPVNEFEETQADQINPNTGERLLNYWGYQPIAFAAPKTSYSARTQADGPVLEFKSMVRELHQAGIEIILDIVFNHTAEGNASGPTFSFRGIDNCVYYMLDQNTGAYLDYSGCGNTLNCNDPIVREMVLRCLRYWVTEMHIDGFRFDLASILGRGPQGEVLPNAPLLEMIAADPVLSDTKLIAEAWDMAGLYQVGRFPSWGRWAEWNGMFRDDIRRFVKGDAGMVPALATRLVGSPDLYEPSHRAPQHSINFVTCHDGFTLADLVSFNDKHNEANGLGNRDGATCNWSWNCGAEGPTNDASILRLRTRQAKNFAALLLLAHGVPLILAGDEFGRTQQGNNNAFCQDDETSWVNWESAITHAEMLRFFRLLIAFRKNHACLRPRSFQTGPRIEWHGVNIGQPDWSEQSRSLAMHVYYRQHEDQAPDNLYLIANAHWEQHTFELPALLDQEWRLFLDTTLDAPFEISEIGACQSLPDRKSYSAGPRSVVVLVGGPALRDS